MSSTIAKYSKRDPKSVEKAWWKATQEDTSCPVPFSQQEEEEGESLDVRAASGHSFSLFVLLHTA